MLLIGFDMERGIGLSMTTEDQKTTKDKGDKIHSELEVHMVYFDFKSIMMSSEAVLNNVNKCKLAIKDCNLRLIRIDLQDA